jgi:Tol biopolymer transport system component
MHPAWSPQGTQIAYAGAGVTGNFDIFVMDADGSHNRNISLHPDDDRAPTWSPDGRQIAFMSNRDGSFNWEIYVMNVDGSNQRNITNNANANDQYPSWQK